jgi:hypothetical protein
MFKKLSKWVKSNIAMLSLSLANIEKNALGQRAETLSDDVKHVKRNTEGQLADSLLQGEVTQEVMNLRWRNYKILKQVEGFKSEIIDYDKDGIPIVKKRKIDKTKGISNVKTDNFDDYPLEMSFINDDVTINVKDVLSTKYLSEKKVPIIIDKDTRTIGDISSLEYYSFYKTQKPLIIERSIAPKFDIEKYTKKLNVRVIDEESRLLEFYVSKYPDEYNKTSKLFINEINKAIKNFFNSNMLNIETVSFITNNTVGSDDFMFYKYNIVKFDKIIEFNGHYVIKFLAKTLINGENVVEKYRQTTLDRKYENKEVKF